MSVSKFSRVSPLIGRLSGGLLSVSLVLGVAASGAVACGPKADNEVKRAQVTASDMPAGADWTGVYFSPLYGHLHLTKEGKMVSAVWRTTSGEAWGELHGEVVGDLLRFEWTEHKIGMVGASATSSGKGYFKYVRPEGADEDKLVGEWGLGSSDAGNSWDAVKQRNMLPDPESVRPDELERGPSGGGWDEPSEREPDPEPTE